MGKTKLKIKQFPSDIKVTKGNKSKKSGQEEMRHQNNLPAMQVLSTSRATNAALVLPSNSSVSSDPALPVRTALQRHGAKCHLVLFISNHIVDHLIISKSFN